MQTRKAKQKKVRPSQKESSDVSKRQLGRFSGIIISDKMNETAVVLLKRLKRHPKYKKTYRVSKKYKAHNPDNIYKEGEKVILQEIRPLSKEKRWRIIGKIPNSKDQIPNKHQ